MTLKRGEEEERRKSPLFPFIYVFRASKVFFRAFDNFRVCFDNFQKVSECYKGVLIVSLVEIIYYVEGPLRVKVRFMVLWEYPVLPIGGIL